MFWYCRNLSHMIAKNRVQFFSSSLSKTKRLDRLHKHFHLVFHRLSKKHCWSWEVRLITTVGWQSKRCSGFQHGSHNIACDRSLRFNLLIKKKKKKTLQLATVSGQLYPKFTTAVCSVATACLSYQSVQTHCNPTHILHSSLLLFRLLLFLSQIFHPFFF